ncbi:hypothetical protein D9M71_496960 [compost metagenome]
MGAISTFGGGGHRHRLERTRQYDFQRLGWRAGGRQPGDDQAIGIHPAHLGADRAPAALGLRRKRSRGHYRRQRRRPGVLQPTLRPSAVHRRLQYRQACAARRRGKPGASDPGAGRQVADHYCSQRRFQGGGDQGRGRQAAQCRPTVRGAGLCVRAARVDGRLYRCGQGGRGRLFADPFGQPRIHLDHQCAAFCAPAGLLERGSQRWRGTDRVEPGG